MKLGILHCSQTSPHGFLDAFAPFPVFAYVKVKRSGCARSNVDLNSIGDYCALSAVTIGYEILDGSSKFAEIGGGDAAAPSVRWRSMESAEHYGQAIRTYRLRFELNGVQAVKEFKVKDDLVWHVRPPNVTSLFSAWVRLYAEPCRAEK